MRLLALATPALLVLLAGCAGSSQQPLTPATTTTSQPVLGGVLQSGDLLQSALGLYSLEIDPASLEATASLKALRSASANDDLYWLPIDNFLRADSFRVSRIQRTTTTLDIEYLVTHPFPAPSNPDGTPNGSTNRSDLGVSGQVVILADVPTAAGNTWFSDVVLNGTLVANADAYTRPAGLLNPGTTANTFPYKVLVDESGPDGARIGVSNGGLASGNFGPDGWTRAEYGGTNDGWTGFGVLHQGQAAGNTLSLDLAALQAAGQFSVDVAILAKYNDPRGGANAAAKRGNRLPPATPDATRFAYRMPHGALDVERITFLSASAGLFTSQPSGTTVEFDVVDWDARATASAEADLALDLDVTTVNASAIGVPTIEVDLGADFGTTSNAVAVVDADPTGDPEADSGYADDPLYYTGLVSTALAPAAPGEYLAVARLVDVESGVPNDWQFYLDADLNPVGVPALPESFQVFPVTVGVFGNQPPTGTAIMTTSTVPDGNAAGIQVTGLSDPDDTELTVSIDWDDDGIDDFTSGPIMLPAGPQNFNSSANGGITFTFMPPGPDYRTLAVTLSDGTNNVDITPALGPNNEHFEVLMPGSCPNPAKVGTDIAGTWPDSFVLASSSMGLPYAQSAGNHDAAAFHAAPYLGWIAFQVCGTATNRDFFRYPDTGTSLGAVRMTNTNLGGFLNSRIAHQIEVDNTNRVVFASKLSSGTVSYPQNTYPIGGAAQAAPDIFWFDYAGTEVTALGGTITTGTERPIALTLASNGDIFMISQTHQLHRYVKATGYTTAGGYPVNLVPIIGDPLITTPAADAWRVHDMVANWHNDSLYVLGVNDTNVAGNARIHRILCDGTEWPGSPVSLFLTDLSTGGHDRSADIAIDQFDATGAAIPEADVQIIVGGANVVANDMHLFNSELVMTSTWDVGASIAVAYRIALAVSTNDIMVSRQSNSGTSNWVFYQTPPAGWE